MFKIWILILAYLLDLVIGDPEFCPHPVRAFGAYINFYKKLSHFDHRNNRQQFLLGVGLCLSLIGLTLLSYGLLKTLFASYSLWLAYILDIYLTYACLSVKSLAHEAEAVGSALAKDGLDKGRLQVSRIVGRQTDKLSQEEVIQATLETVAENTSDGVIAPIFYYLLAGPIGGLIYKAVNTVDSMVGYRNDKYEYFGKFSARLDDLLNYIPARLTALVMLLATKILKYDSQQAWRIWRRDHNQHASPNAGHPESVLAGALGLRLGGGHYYHDQWAEKPYIGDDQEDFSLDHINQANQLLYIASVLMVVSTLLIIGGLSLW